MTDRSNAPATKEERLAAKLRENLQRRKAQARALDSAPAPGADPAQDRGPAESLALPKAPPSG